MKLDLTPVEIAVILGKGELTLKSYYKYTFLDLLLMGMLKIEISSNSNNQYVLAGPNFGRQHPKKHEIPFLSPFVKTRNLKVNFSGYLKLVVSKSIDNIERYVADSADIKPYFKNSLFHKLFGIKSLNEKGKKFKTEVGTYLGKSSVELNHCIKANPPKALQLLTELKGSVLLFSNWNLSAIDQLDERYLQELRGKRPYREYTDFTWLSFPDELFIIQNNYDSDCSSCSSCSSCSGCGGCGGCS